VRLALELLTQGLSVTLRDGTVLPWLKSAAETVFASPLTVERLSSVVAEYQAARTEAFEVLAREGDRAAKLAVRRVEDLCECLLAVALRVQEPSGRIVQRAVVAELSRLFGPGGDVLLTTVHGAKGMEWDRVTILHPERLQLDNGDQEEEDAVTFVALTRSRDRLRFAYGEAAFTDRAWVYYRPGPGVFVQVGSRLVSSRSPEAQGAHFEDEYRGPVPVLRPHEEALFSPPEPEPPARPEVRAEFAGDVRHGGNRRGAASRLGQSLRHALFQGRDVLSREELRGRLQLLMVDPRPGLASFALAALSELVRHRVPDVNHDAALLDDAMTAYFQAREARDTFVAPGAGAVHVMLWQDGAFKVLEASRVVVDGDIVSCHAGGAAFVFGAVSGEEVGQPFRPFASHLLLP